MNFSEFAILNIKGSDYRFIISRISRNEAKNLMQNTNLTKKTWNILKHKNLLSRIKIDKETLTFGNIEIEKNKFYCYKIPVPLSNVDIEKVLVSNKIFFSEKIINTLLVTSLMIKN